MNVDSNSYTFGFATMMVVIVAALLSYAAIELKPFQDTNIELEKQQNILSSIGVDVQRDLAKEVYSKYIKQEIVLNYKGEEVDGDAFEIELKKELKKANSDQVLPLFISNVDGFKQYIIPLRGKGLWGPIWGFIALEEDLNTVYGAVFDHKGETPGLGAEINQSFFQEPFIGKSIFDGETFKSIRVVKGGAPEGDNYAVDGISGGTITSDGVTDMLLERLNMYLPYITRLKTEMEEEKIITEIDSALILNDSLIQ
ncbi:MAG: NADH:ubiquinone reductase (Na(+)-transporting) subunit C [Flavobacteriales bacterium]|nr:NADH:ubiquinone reductase (Na(+)-transporting) subunit C [Flavobacteriales bacterium]